MSFLDPISGNPLRDVSVAGLCEAVRSRMQPYGAPLERGWEIAAFVGLGETWLDAPDSLAEIVTRECPDHEEDTDALRQLFRGHCIALEQLGTPEALNHRVTIGRSLIKRVADAMREHLEGDYRFFEVENNGVHWFDPQPRHLEATRSLVGIFELRPMETAEVGEPKRGQVLLEVEACGICYRDLVDRDGRFPFIRVPITPGHEVVGRVLAVGSQVSDWQVGHTAVDRLQIVADRGGREARIRLGETSADINKADLRIDIGQNTLCQLY